MNDKWLDALEKVVSKDEAKRLREEYVWALQRLMIRGLDPDEIAKEIVKIDGRKS